MDRNDGTENRDVDRDDDRMHPRLHGNRSGGPGVLGYAGAALAAFAGGFLVGRMLPSGDRLRNRLSSRHGSNGDFDPFAPRFTDPAAPKGIPTSSRSADQKPDAYLATDRNAPGRKVPEYQSKVAPKRNGTYDKNELVDKMSEDSFPTSDPPGTY
jgi:hypothetical protein